MSVPAGYITTEAGVIPEDWDAVPLGSLFTFKNGLNKAKQFFGHGTPIVNYMDVFRYPALRMTKVGGRVEVNKTELDSYSVRQGDVFFTRTSETVEEVGIASTMLDAAENTVFSGFVLRARPKGDDLVDQFKAYAFRSDAIRNQIIAKATYTTRALTNGGALSAIYLAKPTKPEQTAIAEALSDMDEAIGCQEAVIAKKRALKTAIMQALLSGTRRLPGFVNDWEVKPVGQFLKLQVGYPFQSRYFSDQLNGIPLVRNRDLRSPGIATYYSGAYRDEFVVRNGDVLIGMDGEFSPVIWGKGRALLNQRVGRLVPKASVDLPFFAYRLLEPLTELERIISATTVKHLSHSDVEQIEMPMPLLEEQVAISKFLTDIDGDLNASIAALTKLVSLKAGVMQQLLAGKIRLV